MCQNACETELYLLRFLLPARQTSAYGKKCAECCKVSYLEEVCRSGQNKTVHDLEQEPEQHYEEEDHIDLVNINSIIFNSKWPIIKSNLKHH